ncbi:MAG: zf-HC2 domain-containing protein [Vicinamibacterales bacterium]
MMHEHPCEEIRGCLEAYHDGELSIDEQVAIQGHLNECVGCSLAVAELEDLSESLRQMASELPNRGPHQSPEVLAGVLERLGVEEQLSLGAQIRSRFQDMHLVWAGLGATVATIVCLVGSMSVLHAASTERPDSLAGVISFLANPGSNANPMPLDVEMHLPRARPNAVFEMSQEEAVLALAAVVTREGRVSNLAVLDTQPRTSLRVKPEVMLAMLTEASQATFEPAIARGGGPIAVNMIWILTNTTVKGRNDDDTLLLVRRQWKAPRVEPAPTVPAPAVPAAPAPVRPAPSSESLTIG